MCVLEWIVATAGPSNGLLKIIDLTFSNVLMVL